MECLFKTTTKYTYEEYKRYDVYEFGSSRIEYSKLYKIIETKTNFYLMLTKNKGYILSKTNFPMGLTEFLKNKSIDIN